MTHAERPGLEGLVTSIEGWVFEAHVELVFFPPWRNNEDSCLVSPVHHFHFKAVGFMPNLPRPLSPMPQVRLQSETWHADDLDGHPADSEPQLKLPMMISAIYKMITSASQRFMTHHIAIYFRCFEQVIGFIISFLGYLKICSQVQVCVCVGESPFSRPPSMGLSILCLRHPSHLLASLEVIPPTAIRHS